MEARIRQQYWDEKHHVGGLDETGGEVNNVYSYVRRKLDASWS